MQLPALSKGLGNVPRTVLPPHDAFGWGEDPPEEQGGLKMCRFHQGKRLWRSAGRGISLGASRGDGPLPRPHKGAAVPPGPGRAGGCPPLPGCLSSPPSPPGAVPFTGTPARGTPTFGTLRPPRRAGGRGGAGRALRRSRLAASCPQPRWRRGERASREPLYPPPRARLYD